MPVSVALVTKRFQPTCPGASLEARALRQGAPVHGLQVDGGAHAPQRLRGDEARPDARSYCRPGP